ncbi:MAG: UpxY family transcription antiterminator [Candidatus Marinimicrobia bacterium]|nr:UpxY family transcription antiterminator [Candidatus Neomarinimicrobiota bacterium]
MNDLEKLKIKNQESEISKSWYAIYVRSRHEKCVYDELQQKNIETSLPLMTVTRQWSDRKKKVEVPLFRGYVFVKIDIIDGKFSVLTTTGVVKFITFCNKTVSIPEEQMFWLQRMMDSELLLTQEHDFPVGVEVDVIFGPLKGLRGRVKRKNSKTRLVVWFDAIMQGVSVEIDPVCLKEAGKTNIAFGGMPLATRPWTLAASR